MHGLFVTGTDTGAGKTVLSAALLAAMRRAGERVRAHKPVVTGLEEQTAGLWPPDHELLGAAAGMDPEEVAPLRFGPAVSPHLAAEQSGTVIDPAAVVNAARGGVAGTPANGDAPADAGAGDPRETVVVEGVGGLLVPFGEDFTVLDLARELGLALVIAARPGLGTINHSLMSVRVARDAGLSVAAVVLTPWPAQPSELELSNRATIARMGALDVEVLPTLAGPDLDGLARAGETLPWRGWLV